MSINIAIDGPAGAGKSTIAKLLAKKLGFIYVDTGALYRSLALYVIENKIDHEDENAVASSMDKAEISLRYIDGQQAVFLGDRNVNDYIRTPQVSQMASLVSALPAVRDKLLSLQRDIAAKENVIMDGRDIGTRILPDADAKIFLTASSRVRAERRCAELKEKGLEANIDEVEKEIIERDERDMNRETAPLVQADDAVLVDTSSLTIEEVVDTIKGIISGKGIIC